MALGGVMGCRDGYRGVLTGGLWDLVADLGGNKMALDGLVGSHMDTGGPAWACRVLSSCEAGLNEH